MKYIDTNKALFSQLKSDYQTHKEGKHYQSQLQSGFDYMEAMIKLFASVNISVIKNINNEIYKTIFTKNFKLTPSLGDFKSLATIPFSKSIKTKLQNKDELYNFLDNLFTQTKHVTLPTLDALLLNTNETKNIKTPLILMDSYVVGFRNKLKGHGASFRTNDEGQRDLVLNTLENIIIYFEDIYDEIANNLEFYFNKNSTITIIYNEIECELLPIISYIECDKFSCSKKHRTKLFFYNDGKDTKSHYIDYSYNHFHQITQRNEIHKSLKKLQEEIVLCTSDMQRQTLLLSNFVGRVEELRVMREHILKAIKNNQTSFTSIIGTPGIGKSALITQLQKALKEDIDTKNQLNSYIFYVQKDTMGVNTEEDKYFYNRLSTYFDKHNVSIKQNLNEIFNLRDNLEKLFEAYEKSPKTKPLLLIIDGLDEFAKPSDILRSIPLTACNKIHIIYSSRPYKKIKDTITAISKENTLENNYSIELGKLLDGEVEELLSRVISKDIQRESQDYKEIVNIIIKQSESLPLYIHYITQELKEENIKNNENIIENIKKWARKLPPKLESFYTDRFKNISLLSRNILQILFFSKSWVSKDDFYTILRSIKKDEFRDIDETDFIEKYFNDIEVFLNIDSQERYGFYHLSVKEQLFEYFKDQNQAFSFNKQRLKEVFIESIIEHYDEYINGMFYLKKGSDIYRLLEDLTKKINYKDTPNYYINNYFHLLNTLIWSNIYIDQLDHEDMRNTRYEKLVETKELTTKNKEDIQNFHTLFKNKKDKQLFEIRYGYELAFIAEDYSQVLVYKDMYENLVQDLFLDIVLNIDKIEYIEKFVEYKDDWIGALNEYVKDFFIKIIAQQNRLDDSFADVLEFLDDEYKAKLVSKLDNLNKALNIIDDINDNIYKSKASVSIVAKMDNLDKALNIIDSNIDDDIYKSKALISIIAKTDNQELLDKFLNIAKKIENDGAKFEAFTSIVSRINDIEKALEIINNNIRDDKYKSNILISLALKVNDENLFLKIKNILKHITCIWCKKEALKLIISNFTEDKLIKIAKIISNLEPEILSTVSIALANKTNNEELLQEAKSMLNDISDSLEKSQSLALIASKTNNQELFIKALKMIESINIPAEFIEYQDDTFIYMTYLIGKMNDTEKALYVANNRFGYFKQEALVSIASSRNNTEEALKIVNNNIDNEYKPEALMSIAIHEKDIKKALEIVHNIETDEAKLKALNSATYKIDNTNNTNKILKLLESISSDEIKLNAFISIVPNMANIKEAIEISKKIPDNKIKVKILDSLISKVNNAQESLKISKELSYLKIKLEVLNYIYFRIKNKNISKILKNILQIEENKIMIIPEMNNVDFWDYLNQDTIPSLYSTLNKINNIEEKYNIINKIFSKLMKEPVLSRLAIILEKKYDNLSPFINTLLYNQLLNNNIKIMETVYIVALLSSDTILKYYGISFEDSSIILYITKLKKLNNSDKDKKEKSAEFKSIKKEILADEILLQEFISLYGEELDIKDEDDFEDEFTIRDINKL